MALPNKLTAFIGIAFASGILVSAGCSKEEDPTKVSAPGYYTGKLPPKKALGGGTAGATAGKTGAGQTQ